MNLFRLFHLFYIFTFVHIHKASEEDEEQKSHRSNFCEIHRKVERREIKLEHALRGKNISVAKIAGLPPIGLMILKEVSRRGQFHFTTYLTERPNPKRNETFSDVLLRDTKIYDLVGDRWVRTIPRLSQGIVYPEAWYDAEFIMVSKEVPLEDKLMFWAFARPFSNALWFLMLAVIILTAIVFFFLDYLHAKAQKKKMSSSIEGCLFASVYSYTGTRSVFQPKSRAAMLLVISMSFFYLILVSAYTANLTKYYLAKAKPAYVINDLNDLVENDLLVCIQRGFSKRDILEKQGIDVRLVEAENEQEILKFVSSGVCDVGIMTKGGYNMFKGDPDFNKECNIDWIGRRVYNTVAGFALADSEELCTSLLDNVLDFFLLQMKREEKIEKILSEFKKNNFVNTCEIKTHNEQEQVTSINVLNVGGIFVLHLFLIFLSILVEVHHHYLQPKEVKDHVMLKAKSNIRQSITAFHLPEHNITSKDNLSKAELAQSTTLCHTKSKLLSIPNKKEFDVSTLDQQTQLDIFFEQLIETNEELSKCLAEQKEDENLIQNYLNDVRTELSTLFRRIKND